MGRNGTHALRRGQTQGRLAAYARICQVVRRVTAEEPLGAPFWVTLQLGSYMPMSMKSMFACGCIAAVALLTACSPRRIPPVTVADLMEDRVALDGILMKCNRDPAKASRDSDCMNARIAVERLAARIDPAVEAKKVEDFEKSREQLRAAEDKKRQEQQSKTKVVDGYHLPVIPVEPTPPPKDPQSPTVSQTSH
jgi:hypothetical protein